jgi:hypothetical protein
MRRLLQFAALFLLMLAAIPVSATITNVTHTIRDVASGSNTGTSLIPATGSLNETTATLLVACYGATPSKITWGSGTTGPVSDSSSNTWHYLTARGPSYADVKTQCAYVYNPTVTSTQTFTLTSSASVEVTFEVSTWSGTLGTSSVFGTENGASSNLSASLATGNVTPAVANELLISSWGMEGTASLAGLAASGFAILDSVAGVHYAFAVAYLVDTATSAIGTTWSQTTAQEEAVNIQSFKPVVAATFIPQVGGFLPGP